MNINVHAPVYQGFQEAVAESAGRLNALLQQGEELIQRSEPADAQVIESQLQELLLYCARVFQGLGRLHTRLLSMRLVSIGWWFVSWKLDFDVKMESFQGL